MTPFERADRAKQLLEDPVLKAAFESIRSGFVSKLEQVALSDVETQHEITLMLQLLKRIKDELTRYANELAIDKQKQKHDTFIHRMRESLTR